MINEIDFHDLIEPAIDWYQKNARDLPWRRVQTPYSIWISEIMLQQTRIEAVKPYYKNFMETLPTVEKLAGCPQDDLLKLWEGLGYYSRAVNLKKAAGVLVEQYNSEMPKDYEEILKLPGIGPYTAGAIASIAYDIPVPAVDGNVLRVIARVADDDRDILLDRTKKEVTEKIKEALPAVGSGLFNQAMMEIGETICLPNTMPDCPHCPWKTFCLAKKRNTQEKLPVRIKKIKRKKEKRTVLLIQSGKQILLHKRPKKGLLAGMYELPNTEGFLSEEEAILYARQFDLDPLHIKKLPPAKHIFSHIEWDMQGYWIKIAETEIKEMQDSTFFMAEIEKTRKSYPVPSAFEKYAAFVNLSLGMEKTPFQT